jgi:thymidylate synthase
MKTFANFTDAYVELIKDVYEEPEYSASPRGMKVKERLGHSFRITNIRDRLPYVPHRKFSASYCIAELLWYVSANNSTEWISSYSSFWRNISDDGFTANSAYGSRIFVPHDRIASSVDARWSQWNYVKEELEKDRDSRRAVIHIRSPIDSILATKDVPCTLALQFFIRDEKLHQVVTMRSSDVILGIAYDVPAFTFFQELLALELGVECGSYTHLSGSMHIYERHYEMARKIISDTSSRSTIPMRPLPATPPVELLNEIEDVYRNTSRVSAPTYDNKIAQFNSARLHVSNIIKFNGLDPYWIDWADVLAAHWAGKMGLDDVRESIMDRVSFDGYKFFAK